MDAWGKSVGAGDKMLLLADGNAAFTKACGAPLCVCVSLLLDPQVCPLEFVLPSASNLCSSEFRIHVHHAVFFGSNQLLFHPSRVPHCLWLKVWSWT